jgi:hydrogenase expression/formation protein HypE
MSELSRVVESAAAAAREAGVSIVAGDTKVVDRGQCDGMYLSTAGAGFVPDGVDVRPGRIQAGDALLVSGDLGRHGIAVLSVREGIAFETTLESDCAPLHGVVRRLIEGGVDLHCLRDLTRGGLAAALNELALDTASTLDVSEAAVPVSEPVQAACELLGLDPLYVANEGRFVAVVAEHDAERTLEILRAQPATLGAARVGTVRSRPSASAGVTLVGPLGARRRLDLLSGEQLPRIC